RFTCDAGRVSDDDLRGRKPLAPGRRAGDEGRGIHPLRNIAPPAVPLDTGAQRHLHPVQRVLRHHAGLADVMSLSTVEVAYPEVTPDEPAAGGLQARTHIRLVIARLRTDRVAIASIVVILLIVLLAIGAPLI